MKLKGRSFLTLRDYTKDEILYLLCLSEELKKKKKGMEFNKKIEGKLLEGKNIVLIFDKSSTRTRCAFESAAYDEGANVTFLTNSQMGKKESLEDTAKVLGRMYDGIEYRGYDQKIVEDLAFYSGVPVFNGLTDQYHPTQALADLLTIKEKFKQDFSKVKLCYVGDGRNNVAISLMIASSKLGLKYTVSSPPSLMPPSSTFSLCAEWAKESKAVIETESDVRKAVRGADVIYTDVWVSMGEEHLIEERIKLLLPYQVNRALINETGKDTIFEHCLPSFHDTNTSFMKDVKEKFSLDEMEVTDEVFRSNNSVVFDQAENRVHTIKAVMVALLSDKELL